MKPQRESFDTINNFDYNEDDEQEFTNIVPEYDAIDKNGKLINQEYFADLIINAEVFLLHEETQYMAKVVCRNIDSNGNIIGAFDENPVLNLLVYGVELTDGAMKHYAEMSLLKIY